jgi:hypothetical protein
LHQTDVIERPIIRGVALLGLLFSASCARQRTIDRDELRSDLTAGISLASETILYLQYAMEGRTSQSFSKGHLHYLAEEADRTKKELEQSVSSPEQAPKLQQTRLQFEALAQELTNISQKSSDPNALTSSMHRMNEIGKAMEKIKGSL